MERPIITIKPLCFQKGFLNKYGSYLLLCLGSCATNQGGGTIGRQLAD